jgi:flagellar basal body-associated protein FliL
MADKHEKPAAPAAPDGAAAPAKKKGLPTPIIIAVLMVLEGAVVYFVMSATGPKAATAEEVQLEGEAGHDTEATVELALMEEKFQNMQTGRVWIWDADIYIKTKVKNEEFVTKQLGSRQAEVREGISMIFRKAQHSNLKEPGLETLNRQISAYLSHILGKDAEGHERFDRVVIPKCKGFPAD